MKCSNSESRYSHHAGSNSTGSVITEGPTNLLPIQCIFCKYSTCIEFDLDLHLYEKHRMELVRLPIGRGGIDMRIGYAIEEGRRVAINLEILNKSRESKDNTAIR